HVHVVREQRHYTVTSLTPSELLHVHTQTINNHQSSCRSCDGGQTETEDRDLCPASSEVQLQLQRSQS
ncbi:hypothetical protein INR49_008150, partial [Caranx melampygus]